MRSSPLRALCPPPRTTSSSSLFGRRVGHLLELVPQKSPLALKAGEALPAPVLYDGKPLEGAGIAQVTLRPRGINTLAVDVERPNDGSLGDAAKALPVDKVLMVATYTFVR